MKFATIIALTLATVGGVLAGDPTMLPNMTYELLQGTITTILQKSYLYINQYSPNRNSTTGWENGRKFYFYTFNVTQFPDSVTTPPAVAPTVPIYKFVRQASDDYHNTTQVTTNF